MGGFGVLSRDYRGYFDLGLELLIGDSQNHAIFKGLGLLG